MTAAQARLDEPDPFAGLSLRTLHRLITETGCTTLDQVAAKARPWPVEWLLDPEEGDLPRVLELCMGPGGWRYGLETILRAEYDVVGVDINADAVATARAAGHRCIHADITKLDPEHPALRHTTGLIISPPCPPFSTGGKHAGLLAHNIQILTDTIDYVGEAAGFVRMSDIDCDALHPDVAEELEDGEECALCEQYRTHDGYAPRSGATWAEVRAGLDGLTDPLIGIMAEVAIWPMGLQAAGAPISWVAMEQSDKLPESILEDLGIEFTCADWCSASWDVLEAADHGLATRRKRTFFIALRGRFDWIYQQPEAVEPFPVTTIAEALEWPEGEQVNTRGKRSLDPATGRPKGGGTFSADKVGWCLTNTARTWYRESDGLRFTTSDAGRLVGFDAAYPWQDGEEDREGSRSSAFKRIGDVVSPVMSARVLGFVLKRPWEQPVRDHLAVIYPSTVAKLLTMPERERRDEQLPLFAESAGMAESA